MRVIDFHTHVFPDEIAPRAVANMQKSLDAAGVTVCLDGTVSDLARSMSDCGIERAVCLPVATKPSQTPQLNQWAAQLQKTNPLFTCFGTVHPGNEDFREVLTEIKALGLRGIKMHPIFQSFSVKDPATMEIFKVCGELGLIVLLHAGLEVIENPLADASPASMVEMLEHCPHTTFVAAHMGGCRQWDEAARCLAGKNIYFDTSLANHYLTSAQFTELVKLHGVDRVLFGTDSPWCSQRDAMEYVDSTDLTQAEKERIFYQNALELLD